MRPPSIPQTITIHEHDNNSVKIMKSIYNALVEYREPKTGRIVVQLFISLPSRKDFPEYFDIIERPISMYEIKKRIESNYYRNEDACISDFKLMFSNCKIFNEDLSQIFQDAVKLEDILFKKHEQLLAEYGRSIGGVTQHTTAVNRGPTTPSTRRTERLTNSNHATANKIKREDSIHSSPIANNNHGANHNNVHTSNSHHLTSTPGLNNSSNNNKSSNNEVMNNNGVANERDNDSNSNLFPSMNGNDNLIITHNYHNETSIDSSSNLSFAGNISTSDRPRRLKKDRDAPKRKLLTGYIIYAAEVRKEYVDKNPDQDFGFISRLIGNDWKALPRDLRVKYDQRALIHNKKIRERALVDSMRVTPNGQPAIDHPSTSRLSKKKLAREAMRQNGLSTPSQHVNSSIQTPSTSRNFEYAHPSASNSNFAVPDRHRTYSPHGSGTLVETSTQTAPIRFVEPPQRKRFAYAENFRRYISSLEVPNQDLLDEELLSERPVEDATNMLGAGIGRHESPEAALWALRDFMLQDSETMRWSLQPYLCY